jgi:mannose-6-phosphate isomerase
MIVKLQPALRSYLWGGTNLCTKWHKQSTEEKISEAWELSFQQKAPSIVAEGADKELIGKPVNEVIPRADWGKNCEKFHDFPVLNKLIDAALPLSIQVHPSDEYALAHEGQYGKTEMWYILEAEEGAYLYMGLNRTVTAQQFAEAIETNTICDYLNKVYVHAGETYFIPSGTIHAIGAGITVYEIQQNSDLTYRVYDYDRTDKNGNKRELHIEKAKAVTNFQKFTVENPNRGELLGKCNYFAVYRYQGTHPVGNDDSFNAITVINGSVQLGNLTLEKGETAFLSAGEHAVATGEGEYIVTTIE